MELIKHRVNVISDLIELTEEFGAEIDLRDWGDTLVLQHDPFVEGLEFEKFLEYYKHEMLILNIKSERIEHRVLKLLKRYHINKYFFLDSSFPMIKVLSDMGEKNVAIRFSEYEGVDTIKNMAGKVNWVWVDCFNEYPINAEITKLLKSLGFKICLVSPELQGHDIKKFVHKHLNWLEEEHVDAICTKFPSFWKEHFTN